MTLPSRIVFVASLLGFLGVALGAFGAHALVDRLTPERLDTFRTGVLYLMLHVPVILTLGLHVDRQPAFARIAWVFVAGVGVFTGSLSLLVLLDVAQFGAVTPLGGVLLLVGWAMLARLALRRV